MVGWVSGASGYNGHVWELHPLVVHPNYRSLGIGRALVLDFEQQVSSRGGTVYLGTDDEDNFTSLGGVDLYPDVLSAWPRSRTSNATRSSFTRNWAMSL